jgi:CheY-like chemotaxis protein
MKEVSQRSAIVALSNSMFWKNCDRHHRGCNEFFSRRARLFKPFFTTHEAGAGTGPGLATACGIVKQNHGDIELSSKPGRETEIRVRVPESMHHEKTPLSATEVASRRETILLVEDEQAVRDLTSLLLRGWGYSVLEAALPSEAIAIAQREGDAIRLLLTDVVMPEMRGGELASRILPSCRFATVLFMSGYPDDEDLGLGRGSRDHFLPKPFTPESLARKVREAIDGE